MEIRFTIEGFIGATHDLYNTSRLLIACFSTHDTGQAVAGP